VISLAKGALTMLMNHLWYLREELAALAFFDGGVTLAEKKPMVALLQSEVCKERKRTFNRFFGILGIRQDF
jgi:hypothetical protein